MLQLLHKIISSALKSVILIDCEALDSTAKIKKNIQKSRSLMLSVLIVDDRESTVFMLDRLESYALCVNG